MHWGKRMLLGATNDQTWYERHQLLWEMGVVAFLQVRGSTAWDIVGGSRWWIWSRIGWSRWFDRWFSSSEEMMNWKSREGLVISGFCGGVSFELPAIGGICSGALIAATISQGYKDWSWFSSERKAIFAILLLVSQSRDSSFYSTSRQYYGANRQDHNKIHLVPCPCNHPSYWYLETSSINDISFWIWLHAQPNLLGYSIRSRDW